MALPRAHPAWPDAEISRMPRVVSAAMAAHARKGMVNAGMKEFT
jgi:hypothetical protein